MSSVTAPPAISSIVAKVSSAKVKWNLWTKTKKKWDQLNKLETFDFVLTDRVVSRIYRLEEKSRVGEGHELPVGTGVAEMQSGAFLRHKFEKCYSVCTDFVTSGRFFQYSYLYTEMITIFLRGKLGILGGKLLPLKYPR